VSFTDHGTRALPFHLAFQQGKEREGKKTNISLILASASEEQSGVAFTDITWMISDT
jgi:hypothetical protein